MKIDVCSHNLNRNNLFNTSISSKKAVSKLKLAFEIIAQECIHVFKKRVKYVRKYSDDIWNIQNCTFFFF